MAHQGKFERFHIFCIYRVHGNSDVGSRNKSRSLGSQKVQNWGTWKPRNIEKKTQQNKSQHTNPCRPMNRKTKLLAPYGAISSNFLRGPKTSKIVKRIAYLPWWANGQQSRRPALWWHSGSQRHCSPCSKEHTDRRQRNSHGIHSVRPNSEYCM